MKISIFDQNFDFWPKLKFSVKFSRFDQNFAFWSIIRSFNQNFLWPTNRYLIELLLEAKFRSLGKISSISSKMLTNFVFWQKFNKKSARLFWTVGKVSPRVPANLVFNGYLSDYRECSFAKFANCDVFEYFQQNQPRRRSSLEISTIWFIKIVSRKTSQSWKTDKHFWFLTFF